MLDRKKSARVRGCSLVGHELADEFGGVDLPVISQDVGFAEDHFCARVEVDGNCAQVERDGIQEFLGNL